MSQIMSCARPGRLADREAHFARARSARPTALLALPELLARFSDPSGQLPSGLNLVTDPSSTADIELVLVRGVPGPGALEVAGLDWDL